MLATEWFTFAELRALAPEVTAEMMSRLAARFELMPESKARVRKADIGDLKARPIERPVEYHISTLPPMIQAQIRAKFAPSHIADRIRRLGIWRTVYEPTRAPASDVSEEELASLGQRFRDHAEGRKA